MSKQQNLVLNLECSGLCWDLKNILEKLNFDGREIGYCLAVSGINSQELLT